MRLRSAHPPNGNVGAPETGEHTKAARLLACLLGQHQNHLCGKNSGKLPDDTIFTSSFPQLVFCRAQTPSGTREHSRPKMDDEQTSLNRMFEHWLHCYKL